MADNRKPDWVNNPNDWEIVFEDLFDQASLDLVKWNAGTPFDTPNIGGGSDEKGMYDASALQFGGGKLSIVATKPTEEVPFWNGSYWPYVSGMIQTANKFSCQYGYFEIECQMPLGQGFWSAFWMLPGDPVGTWPPEWDVFEHHGHDPHTMYYSMHYVNEADEIIHDTRTFKGPNMHKYFNRYAFDVKPGGNVDFYFNGIRRDSWTNIPNLDHAIYPLANVAVGGNWPGDPDETTPFPGKMVVKHIRIRRRKDNYGLA